MNKIWSKKSRDTVPLSLRITLSLTTRGLDSQWRECRCWPSTGRWRTSDTRYSTSFAGWRQAFSSVLTSWPGRWSGLIRFLLRMRKISLHWCCSGCCSPCCTVSVPTSWPGRWSGFFRFWIRMRKPFWCCSGCCSPCCTLSVPTSWPGRWSGLIRFWSEWGRAPCTDAAPDVVVLAVVGFPAFTLTWKLKPGSFIPIKFPDIFDFLDCFDRSRPGSGTSSNRN